MSMSQQKPAATVYANVIFRNQKGKIRLTQEKIAFKPYDWSVDAVYDSWRWTAVLKHQVNNQNAKKALLKLVSKEDTTKCVIFQMENHAQLNEVRNDVTDRMRECRRAERQRQHELLRQDQFYTNAGRQQQQQQRRRGSTSEKSFNTVPVNNSNYNNNKEPEEEDEEGSMPDLQRADTDKISNRRKTTRKRQQQQQQQQQRQQQQQQQQQQPKMMLMDPRTDMGAGVSSPSPSPPPSRAEQPTSPTTGATSPTTNSISISISPTSPVSPTTYVVLTPTPDAGATKKNIFVNSNSRAFTKTPHKADKASQTVPPPKTTTTKLTLFGRLLLTLLLGILIIWAFHKAANLGCLNGVTDNTPLQERIIPRFILQQQQQQQQGQKPGLTMGDQGFCLWENKSSVVGESQCKKTFMPVRALL